MPNDKEGMDTLITTSLGNGIVARVRPGEKGCVFWVHGYTIDSSLWGDLWQYLPGWHHVGIDLLGHGLSEPMPKGITLPQLAQVIGNLAIEQGAQHIVGLSFGSMIALQIIIEFPGRFSSLTLGAPGLAGGPEDPHARDRYRQMIQTYWQQGTGMGLTKLWMTWPPDIFKGAARHPALWTQLEAVVGRHSWREIRDFSMQGLTSFRQTQDLLAQVQVPTLVLVGDEEMPAFKECAAILQGVLPRCQTEYLPATGHLCMLEAPEIAAPYMNRHFEVCSVNGA